MWIEIEDWWLSAGVEYVMFFDMHIIYGPLFILTAGILLKLLRKWNWDRADKRGRWWPNTNNAPRQ